MARELSLIFHVATGNVERENEADFGGVSSNLCRKFSSHNSCWGIADVSPGEGKLGTRSHHSPRLHVSGFRELASGIFSLSL